MSTKKLSKKLQMINCKTLLVAVDIGMHKNTGYAPITNQQLNLILFL